MQSPGARLSPARARKVAMIVSHEHRFIFLKARKVAGTSFEIALSKYLSDGDIITPITPEDEEVRKELGFCGPRNFNYGVVDFFRRNRQVEILGRKVPLKYYNHIPAGLVQNRLPAEVWRDYRKISIVRNPWDWAVSIFFWRHSRKGRKPHLEKFTPYFNKKPEVLDVNHRNYMVDGRDVIDRYIRYEHFEEDIGALEREMPSLLGLWGTFRSIRTKGKTRDRSLSTAEIFARNPEVNALIEQRNAWEIEKFSYRLS